MTTWMPFLICLAYQASRFDVSTLARRTAVRMPSLPRMRCRRAVTSCLCVDRENLAASTFRKFYFYLFDEPALFRIDMVLRQIASLSDDESDLALRLAVEFRSVERSQSIGVVRIQQQGVQHRAQHRAITPVLLQGRPNVVFQLPISLPHVFAHGDAQVGLFVTRKFVGDVLQEDEGTQLHQKFAEEQR